MYDVIVAGLGGLGSAAAYELASRGQKVLGLEKHTPTHDKGSSHGKGALYRPAGRPRLLGVIHNLHINFDRYLRLHFSAMRYREKGQQEHREILERCKQRDEEGAVEALRLHIQTVSEMLFGYLAGK